MITWRNRPINTLSAAELRAALEDAVLELVSKQDGANPDILYRSLLVGYAAGAATAVIAIIATSLLS